MNNDLTPETIDPSAFYGQIDSIVAALMGDTGSKSWAAVGVQAVADVTKVSLGLDHVDNTADTGKPVSTAQQTALNLKANLESPTFTGTVAGITKAMVGLTNADDTADASKPVSTAQGIAINARMPGFVEVPATAAAAGTAGTMAADANYIYYCVASGQWVRAAWATWGA